MPDDTISKRHSVRIQGNGAIDADEGRRLVLAIEDAGIDILHRCGGNARCATCRVDVHEGDPGPITVYEERRLAELRSRRPTTRLSCQVQVRGDLAVEIRRRLSDNPELGDAGPRPIEWPVERSLPPDDGED